MLPILALGGGISFMCEARGRCAAALGCVFNLGPIAPFKHLTKEAETLRAPAAVGEKMGN